MPHVVMAKVHCTPKMNVFCAELYHTTLSSEKKKEQMIAKLIEFVGILSLSQTDNID
jgi:hypothetical protein